MLDVSASGARRWVFRITVRGKRRDLGLGGFPRVTLAEAREQAEAYRSTARAGGDPVSGKAPVPTFKEAAAIVHAAGVPHWKNARHAWQWLRSLELYAFPALGRMPVDAVETRHIVEAVMPIWSAMPETGKRTLGRISAVMEWALGMGHISANPAAAAKRILPRQKASVAHHAAMPYADTPAAVASLVGRLEARRGARTAAMLLTAVLAAARSGEVRGMEWSEVDLAERLWAVPASRMKGSRDHRVPLSRQLHALLARLHEHSTGVGLVFPNGDGGEISDMTMLLAARRWLAPGITVHGFRSSFRDWAGEQSGAPHAAIELCLAHHVGSAVERAYARSDLLERRRQLMQEWADFCWPGT